MDKLSIKEENGEIIITTSENTGWITRKKTYRIYAELEYESKTGRINYGGEYVVKLKIK